MPPKKACTIYFLPQEPYVGQTWSTNPNRLQARLSEHKKSGKNVDGAKVLYRRATTKGGCDCREAVAIQEKKTHVSQGGKNKTVGNGPCAVKASSSSSSGGAACAVKKPVPPAKPSPKPTAKSSKKHK